MSFLKKAAVVGMVGFAGLSVGGSAQAAANPSERTPSTVAAPGGHQAAKRVVTLQNRHTRACMDDSNEYGLRGFSCNGLNFQRWNIVLKEAALWTITNQATARCLDDSNEYGLRTVECNGGLNQNWTVQDKGGLELWNRATGRCADDSPAGLRTFQCNDQDYQRWDT